MRNINDHILYFGYGAMASPKLIEVLLERKVYGSKALIQNYGLFVNSWNAIPEEARTVLKTRWNKNFSHYSIKMHRGDFVLGKLYKITLKEREMIAKWNLFEEGMFIPIKVLVQDEEGRESLAETETFFTSDSTISYADGQAYYFFLNNRSKMFEVARRMATID